jgi:predicted NUDIX family NTP pyrophosphohydrolase
MRKSAGLLVFRRRADTIELFLVHPGGPYWKDKDAGAWSVPKGEFDEREEPLEAAIREFREETGQEINGEFLALVPVKQKAGKMVFAWAVEANVDATNIVSNTFKMEYPYNSGKWISVPEVDRAAWFSVEEAKHKINPAQVQLIDELLTKLHEKAI